MAREWYIIQTFTGYENKIEKHIRTLMADELYSPAILDVHVPTEEVTDLRNGKKYTRKQKLFPGYVLLELDIPQSGWQIPVNAIRRIDGVSCFLGSAKGARPVAISEDEAQTMLCRGGSKAAKARVRQNFFVDEPVRITEGPFGSFTGKVSEVDNDKARLKVLVGVFGRATSVEVEFDQVEKI